MKAKIGETLHNSDHDNHCFQPARYEACVEGRTELAKNTSERDSKLEKFSFEPLLDDTIETELRPSHKIRTISRWIWKNKFKLSLNGRSDEG